MSLICLVICLLGYFTDKLSIPHQCLLSLSGTSYITCRNILFSLWESLSEGLQMGSLPVVRCVKSSTSWRNHERCWCCRYGYSWAPTFFTTLTLKINSSHFYQASIITIPSKWEGLQGLFQEDAEEDEHQASLNTTGHTCFLVRRLYQSWEGFHTHDIMLVLHLVLFPFKPFPIFIYILLRNNYWCSDDFDKGTQIRQNPEGDAQNWSVRNLKSSIHPFPASSGF